MAGPTLTGAGWLVDEIDTGVVYINDAGTSLVSGDGTLFNLTGPGGTVAAYRPFGRSETAGLTCTFHMTCRAPAEYDGVRVVVHNATSSGTNTYKVSVAAPAAMTSQYAPLDAAGSSLALTALTFGNTDPFDPRNPGGGAANTLVNNASGTWASGATGTLRVGYAISDYLPLSSLARTDIVGAPPLFCLRLYGVNPGWANYPESGSASPNPMNVAEPDWYSGYWNAADHTATANPGSAPTQGGFATVTVLFYLRGRRVLSFGFTGDSLEQGWVNTTAVPLTAGLIEGWPRKLVRALNAAGRPASLCGMFRAGEASYMSHEQALTQLLIGGLSHLWIKPYSTNEDSAGLTQCRAALARTTQLIELAKRKTVKPIIIRPWAGQTITTAQGQLVQTYCDNAAASGLAVFDARLVVADAIGTDTIKSEYLTRTAGGAAVDTIHLNDAGHQAVAAYAMAQLQTLLAF